MAATIISNETRRPPKEGPGAAAASTDAPLTGRNRLPLDAHTPMNQNGCFEFDRVLKCGHVQKRTRRTKSWKSVYLVLRANAISLYKNDKETKLRHQIHLSDLSAVTFLKDPKGKRKNLFGLFSASRNFHFEAPTAQDAREWVDLIRTEARLEEEKEDMFLNGSGRRSMSPVRTTMVMPGSLGQILDNSESAATNMLSSSSEYQVVHRPHPTTTNLLGGGGDRRRISFALESSGLSGNEMPSYSDLSDLEMQRMRGASCESLAVQPPMMLSSAVNSSLQVNGPQPGLPGQRPHTAGRSASQIGAATGEQESERVIWQGWLWRLQSKGGVRQWKHMWGVLRGRNLILYKDESEYTAQWIVDVSDVVDVIDTDPISKHKVNCLQIITEEKSYRFCAHDEESLVNFMGAFKSLLAKRRSLEARAAAAVKVSI